MRRLLVTLLLLAFIPVSVLGHAGFQVLGIHSHCECHPSANSGHRHTVGTCSHHHHGHHHHSHGVVAQTRETPSPSDSQEHSHSPSQESQDCVLCQFLSCVKSQTNHTFTPECISSLVIQKLVFSNDFFVVFDYSLRPIPRGPPVINA